MLDSKSQWFTIRALCGGVAEWSNAPVLKTDEGEKPTESSNLSSSATLFVQV